MGDCLGRGRAYTCSRAEPRGVARAGDARSCRPRRPDSAGGTAQNPTRPDPATAPADPAQTPVPEGALGVTTADYAQTPAAADVGVPIEGGKGIMEQVTPIGREAATFHNVWLLTLCALISIFVLALLLYAIVRFRRGANPVPSRNSHNTLIEVIWTVVPVLILVAIAIPRSRLLRHQYTPPPADLTIKVTGTSGTGLRISRSRHFVRQLHAQGRE
jgi:cytochrome c oxidase subunit 2